MGGKGSEGHSSHTAHTQLTHTRRGVVTRVEHECLRQQQKLLPSSPQSNTKASEYQLKLITRSQPYTEATNPGSDLTSGKLILGYLDPLLGYYWVVAYTVHW